MKSQKTKVETTLKVKAKKTKVKRELKLYKLNLKGYPVGPEIG